MSETPQFNLSDAARQIDNEHVRKHREFVKDFVGVYDEPGQHGNHVLTTAINDFENYIDSRPTEAAEVPHEDAHYFATMGKKHEQKSVRELSNEAAVASAEDDRTRVADVELEIGERVVRAYGLKHNPDRRKSRKPTPATDQEVRAAYALNALHDRKKRLETMHRASHAEAEAASQPVPAENVPSPDNNPGAVAAEAGSPERPQAGGGDVMFIPVPRPTSASAAGEGSPQTVPGEAGDDPHATRELPIVPPPVERVSQAEKIAEVLVDPNLNINTLDQEALDFLDLTVQLNEGAKIDLKAYDKLRRSLNANPDYPNLGDRLLDLHANGSVLADSHGTALNRDGLELITTLISYDLMQTSRNGVSARKIAKTEKRIRQLTSLLNDKLAPVEDTDGKLKQGDLLMRQYGGKHASKFLGEKQGQKQAAEQQPDAQEGLSRRQRARRALGSLAAKVASRLGSRDSQESDARLPIMGHEDEDEDAGASESGKSKDDDKVVNLPLRPAVSRGNEASPVDAVLGDVAVVRLEANTLSAQDVQQMSERRVLLLDPTNQTNEVRYAFRERYVRARGEEAYRQRMDELRRQNDEAQVA